MCQFWLLHDSWNDTAQQKHWLCVSLCPHRISVASLGNKRFHLVSPANRSVGFPQMRTSVCRPPGMKKMMGWSGWVHRARLLKERREGGREGRERDGERERWGERESEEGLKWWTSLVLKKRKIIGHFKKLNPTKFKHNNKYLDTISYLMAISLPSRTSPPWTLPQRRQVTASTKWWTRREWGESPPGTRRTETPPGWVAGEVGVGSLHSRTRVTECTSAAPKWGSCKTWRKVWKKWMSVGGKTQEMAHLLRCYCTPGFCKS